MKKITRRSFIASTTAVLGLAATGTATRAADNPAFTPENVTRLFNKDARGRDLSREQINAIAREVSADVRGYISKHFTQSPAQVECARNMSAEAWDEFATLISKVYDENGTFSARLLRSAEHRDGVWQVNVRTEKGNYQTCYPPCG